MGKVRKFVQVEVWFLFRGLQSLNQSGSGILAFLEFGLTVMPFVASGKTKPGNENNGKVLFRLQQLQVALSPLTQLNF
ncbi:hypothetical protein V6N13_095055 [Hibiscus sabdariffa]